MCDIIFPIPLSSFLTSLLACQQDKYTIRLYRQLLASSVRLFGFWSSPLINHLITPHTSPVKLPFRKWLKTSGNDESTDDRRVLASDSDLCNLLYIVASLYQLAFYRCVFARYFDGRCVGIRALKCRTEVVFACLCWVMLFIDLY